jgi:hypothetical protein
MPGTNFLIWELLRLLVSNSKISSGSILKMILICQSFNLIGQNISPGTVVQGRIINAETKEPLAYVNISIPYSQNGTISDFKGYFKISVPDTNDTLHISCIGFKKQIIPLFEKKAFYTIYLEQNIQLLNQVTITAPDNRYLYELLADCRKDLSTGNRTAKAYYEISSYAGDDQIELVEAFFNADLKGYDLLGLELKTGRFALKKTGNRFFNTMESSRAIVMDKLFAENEYFPQSPLVLTNSKMSKKFYLELEKKYLENALDSVYVIRYIPKDTCGVFFNGQIWIDPQKKHVMKMTFECRNCGVTPFVPLFSTDSLSNINFKITKTFNEIDNKMFLNHIDFIYGFEYDSRIGHMDEANYSIMSNAVLHVYNYNDKFFIPKFSFNGNCVRDYFKIMAMPYNSFFWENNNEFEIIDYNDQNAIFYRENEACSSRNWYSDNQYFKKVFEGPFIAWSEKRILIKDVAGDSLASNMSNPGIIADKYNLSVKIFMDINTYSDSTNVVTSTVFDPWETFYYLPIDTTTNCFLNIYFDICEIERRNFEKAIQGLGHDTDEILRKYEELNAALNKIKNQYLEEADRGTNRKALEKWNQYIVDKLGIDNLILFKLFGDNNRLKF